MSALDHPPTGVAVHSALDGVEIDLPNPADTERTGLIPGAILIAGMVALGAANLAVETVVGPPWGSMFAIAVYIGGCPALLGLLIWVERVRTAIAQRQQERVALDPHGITIVRGERTSRYAWNEVITFAQKRGLVCVDGFVSLGATQPGEVQQWLREVIIDTKRAHEHGSSREIPAALRRLQAEH